jgi:hypothetical protein
VKTKNIHSVNIYFISAPNSNKELVNIIQRETCYFSHHTDSVVKSKRGRLGRQLRQGKCIQNVISIFFGKQPLGKIDGSWQDNMKVVLRKAVARIAPKGVWDRSNEDVWR